MALEKLKAKASAEALDWAFVQQVIDKYGQAFASFLFDLLAAWKSHPASKAKAKAGARCDGDLEAALDAARKSSCTTCCEIMHARCAAGLDCDDEPVDPPEPPTAKKKT